MREILFRGKTFNGGGIDGWATGSLIVCGNGIDYFISSGKMLIDCAVKCGKVCFSIAQVKPETVGQWTGFTDVNGVDIYDGDLVTFEDAISTENGYSEDCCDGEVFWDEETASFQVTNRLSCESSEALSECAVIGNKWDGVKGSEKL